MKHYIMLIAVSVFIFCSGLSIDSIDFTSATPVIFAQAHAYYGTGRRMARRTARRTARRVSRRHNYYRAPAVYGAGAVAAGAAAVAVGTRVVTLPGACSSVVINGLTYYNCGGTYYQPVYDGPQVVYVVVDNPQY